MNTSFAQQLREEFDLPTPIAVWVVVTHIFVLSCPLVLIWAIDKYSSLLPQSLSNATLVQLASAVYIGATAFEVAQNSADRWYLTEATRSVADLFFNAFMTVAFCMYTIGFYGNIWMSMAAIILTIIYPFAYIKNHPSHRGINGTVVLLATASLYLVTGDPAVFLFLAGTGLGGVFDHFPRQTACAVVTRLGRIGVWRGVSCVALGDRQCGQWRNSKLGFGDRHDGRGGHRGCRADALFGKDERNTASVLTGNDWRHCQAMKSGSGCQPAGGSAFGGTPLKFSGPRFSDETSMT